MDFTAPKVQNFCRSQIRDKKAEESDGSSAFYIRLYTKNFLISSNLRNHSFLPHYYNYLPNRNRCILRIYESEELPVPPR